MKHTTIVRYVGILSCLGALSLGSSLASAQPPATKQPPAPKGKPAEMPPPKTASDEPGKTSEPTKTGEQAKKEGPATADHRFAMSAAEGGILEVELGRIASQRAANADVKSFAQRMVDDHGKANDELKSIASSKNITLPDEAKVKAKHQAMLSRLEKLEGAAFDKAYMEDMVKDHTKDVAAFEREANTGKDPELQAFAKKTLPTLRDHLKLARETRSKVTTKGTN